MDLTRWQSVAALVGAPVGTATLFGNAIYHYLVSVGATWMLALAAAVFFSIALEFSGAVMCVSAIKAWQRGRGWMAFWAIVGAGFYAAFVTIGIYVYDRRAGVFIATVGVTLVAYAGYAIYGELRKGEGNDRDARAEEKEERRLRREHELNLKRLEAQPEAPKLDLTPLSGRVVPPLPVELHGKSQFTPMDVMEIMDVKSSRAYEILEDWRKSGVVTRIRRGVYRAET